MYADASLIIRWLATMSLAVVVGCSSTSELSKQKKPVVRTKLDFNNACDIFDKNPDWLKGALKSSRRWQVPVFVMLAIIHQESRFVATARPLNPNKKSKKKYASSAYGYAQALDGTWKEYKQKTGNTRGRRDDFSSAVDFIGWYVLQAHKINGISKWATDKVYLNYHEGLGGYKRKTYKRKPWLVQVADKVKKRGSRYADQLKGCNVPLYIEKNGKLPKIDTSRKSGSTNKLGDKVNKTNKLDDWF